MSAIRRGWAVLLVLPCLGAAAPPSHRPDKSDRPSRTAKAARDGNKRISELRKQLHQGGTLARQDAVVALGEMGPEAEPAIPALMAAINDPRTQRLAFVALSKIGPAAVPPLLAANHEEDYTVHSFAVQALADMGPAAVPLLSAALRHKDVRVRKLALDALLAPDTPPVEAIPALIRLLRTTEAVPHIVRDGYGRRTLRFHDPDEPARKEAAKALARMGPKACAALLDLLASCSDRPRLSRALSSVQENALSAIYFFPQLEATQERLRQDRMVRLLVLTALRDLGPDARAAVPHLNRLVKHPDAAVRGFAIEALRNIGPDPRTAISPLLEALEDDRDYHDFTAFQIGLGSEVRKSVRVEATRALLSLGPEAKARLVREGLPILVAAMRESDDDDRPPSIAEAIGLALFDLVPIIEVWDKIGPDLAKPILRLASRPTNPGAPQPFRALACWAIARRSIALLQAKDAKARARAADRLGRLGPSAKRAVPALCKALADEDRAVSLAAARALLQIEGNSKPALAKLVNDLSKDADTAKAASEALAELARDLTEIVPELRKLLRSDVHCAHVRAASLLGKAGPPFAKEAVEVVIELIKRPDRRSSDRRDEDWDILVADLEAFGPAVVPALLTRFSDMNGHHCHRVIAALPRLGPDAHAALPLLAKFVDDPDSGLRSEAALALGKFGPSAAPAVPSLMGLLLDGGEPEERAVAAKALGWIGPAASRAVPRLRAAARHDVPLVRDWARFALARITRTEVELVRALLHDVPTRPEAAEVLSELGPDARAAIPVLAQAAITSDWQAPSPAEQRRLRTTPFAALASVEWDRLFSVRWAAAEALGNLGPAAAPALGHLLTVLPEEEYGLREVVTISLGKTGRAALPHLRGALAKEKAPATRRLLHRTIRRISAAP
jgi:HEAT repeat protein